MKTFWQHGEQPTAAILNEYRTALIDAHTTLGDDGGWSEAHEKISEASFVMLHTWRYLHFTSTGQITDLYGNNALDLEENADGQGRIDLDTLDWLVYGQLYRVNGVSVCMEDWST